MRHLFDCWPQAARSIRAARSLALFLDLDGTLVALQRLPSDVKPLDVILRGLLRRLAAHKELHVYVISGRSLAELRRLVPVRNVQLLGLHGWEGRHVPSMREERQLLRAAKQELNQQLSKADRVWVEDKSLSLAVHYRGALPRAVSRARGIVRQVLRKAGPRIHMVRGHKLWELLPSQIEGKGPAVAALLSNLPRPTFPIFVGDDVTDESAFRVLPHGLTIRVGEKRRTCAGFFLRDPGEVRIFLLKLEAAVV